MDRMHACEPAPRTLARCGTTTQSLRTGRGWRRVPDVSDSIEARHESLTVTHGRDAEFGCFVFSGRITDAALVTCLLAVWRHPDYEYAGPELYDFSAADASGLTSEGVRALAEANAEVFTGRPDYRSAIVVSAPLLFGFSRMFSAYAGDRGDNVAVFESVKEARYWLREQS